MVESPYLGASLHPKLTSSTLILLRPGDLLYIPRGTVHEARTNSSEVSLHLTLGVEVATHFTPQIYLHHLLRTTLQRPSAPFVLHNDDCSVLVTIPANIIADFLHICVHSLARSHTFLRSAMSISNALSNEDSRFDQSVLMENATNLLYTMDLASTIDCMVEAGFVVMTTPNQRSRSYDVASLTSFLNPIHEGPTRSSLQYIARFLSVSPNEFQVSAVAFSSYELFLSVSSWRAASLQLQNYLREGYLTNAAIAREEFIFEAKQHMASSIQGSDGF